MHKEHAITGYHAPAQAGGLQIPVPGGTSLLVVMCTVVPFDSRPRPMTAFLPLDPRV
jgi:hypothetical protein